MGIRKTENGAICEENTGAAALDLFFNTVRGLEKGAFEKLLEASWKEDALDTLKLIFQLRDCRGGKGERTLFRNGLVWLANNHLEDLIHNLKHVPTFGRWDDLFCLFGLKNELTDAITTIIVKQLNEDVENMKNEKPISLLAKWLPTEKKHWDKENKSVKIICKALNVNKAEYRKKYISPLRAHLDVVERKMCAKEWNMIDFEKVPSKAMTILKKAFEKNDPDGWKAYLAKLTQGKAKVNSSVLDPHEIVRQYFRSNAAESTIIDKQWEGIVERVRKLGSFERAVVMADVSGSMSGEPMEVSVAMGLLVSELSTNFKNQVITFDSNPVWHYVDEKHSLKTKVQKLLAAPWGGSTNFNRAITMILEQAKQKKLKPEEVPDTLFVISDMQFSHATGRGTVTNFEALKSQYMEYGYKVPRIVFWNVRSNTKGAPATTKDGNVAMVSGYSPSIMKSILEGDDLSPLGVLRSIIDDERYECITLCPSKKGEQKMEEDEDEDF